jgi:hypothetical protein
MRSNGSETEGAGKRREGVGRQVISDARRGVPRWLGAGFTGLLVGVLYHERNFRTNRHAHTVSKRKVLTVVQCMLSLVVIIVLVAWAVETL